MDLGAEPLEIVDETVPAVFGVLVVDPDVNRLLGADFLAVAAEDAAELVNLLDQRIPVALGILTGNQFDAVGRADLGAEPAGHALGPALLVGHHAVGTPPPGGNGVDAPGIGGALFLGILHRHLGLEHVLEGEGHPLERRADVAHLALGTLEDLHFDCHQGDLWADRGDRGDEAGRR